jgi:hypothetical protein
LEASRLIMTPDWLSKGMDERNRVAVTCFKSHFCFNWIDGGVDFFGRIVQS